MKKLIVDAKPLLLHNMKQAQIGFGEYEVFCQKTFQEAFTILCKGKFPSKIDWKYPEQFLTTRQMAHIAKTIDKMDIEVSILSANCIFAVFCNMDYKSEMIMDVEYGFDAYGHNYSDLWEHIQ